MRIETDGAIIEMNQGDDGKYVVTIHTATDEEYYPLLTGKEALEILFNALNSTEFEANYKITIE